MPKNNNFGAKVNPFSLAKAAELTRRQLAHQPAGAAFPQNHEVSQWTCRCGRVNPPRKARCTNCEEPRPT